MKKRIASINESSIQRLLSNIRLSPIQEEASSVPGVTPLRAASPITKRLSLEPSSVQVKDPNFVNNEFDGYPLKRETNDGT